MLKAGDVVTYGGSIRYVVMAVRHASNGGNWRTTIIVRQLWNYPNGFDGFWQECKVVGGYIVSGYPGGCVRKVGDLSTMKGETL